MKDSDIILRMGEDQLRELTAEEQEILTKKRRRNTIDSHLRFKLDSSEIRVAYLRFKKFTMCLMVTLDAMKLSVTAHNPIDEDNQEIANRIAFTRAADDNGGDYEWCT